MNPIVSVIIVTYKRDQDAIAAVENVLKQQGQFEIIIIDNDSTSNLDSKLPDANNIRYFKQQNNLGCGGGRNVGATRARGQYMVFLDDDAEFKSNDVFLKVADLFDQYPKVGCLAFQIRNYFTNEIDTKEFPHPNHRLNNETIKVSYYVGAGHAIRKNVYETSGSFMDLVYAHEELDFSFNMIKAGYELLYTPDIIVLHKVSIAGRSTNKRFIYFNVRNRYFVLSNHLPLYYLFVNISLWNIVWLARALRIGALWNYFHGIWDGSVYFLKSFSKTRKVLTGKQLEYLKKNGGRLWY